MKRLAIIPTVFALVAMVAACTDMTAPEVTPPQFGHGGPVVGQCPIGWERIHDDGTGLDLNGDGFICLRAGPRGQKILTDNTVPLGVALPDVDPCGGENCRVES